MPSPPRPTPGPRPVSPEPRPSSVAPRPPPIEVKDAPRDRRPPQEIIDEFWKDFSVEKPSKATTIIPQNEYAEKAAATSPAPERTTRSSYAEAAAICRTKVRKIADECRAINRKYRDPHFDLEADLKLNQRDCLESLCNRPGPGPAGDDEPDAKPPPLKPMGVKRVADIFDEPQFYIDGPSTNDVRQGKGGDCWLLAALCTLSNKEGLIDRICVERDEQVGVYGFVFHRDGEWFSEIIDDKLYLKRPDYDESFIERMIWEDRDRVDSEEAYRRTYQTNSGALYFSQCEHPNETWLPLLEKAYAKAHGDYSAIEGGFTGEGIEDLTGGVTTEIYTSDILDREAFWRDELMQVNKEFLFGCSTGIWGRGRESQKGILSLHAYSVMRAVEAEGQRLVLLKNPWGKGEWKGPWSDGSKEWTADWLRRLDHQFGDDGAFWISYADLLRKYQSFDRTRLFGGDWRVASVWTTLSIPWKYDYHDTHFAFTLASAGEVVIVLSQLDDRYFRGLEGQYEFSLAFRLHRSGHEDYIVRTPPSYRMRRSVNVEVKLEAGDYTVMVKVDCLRDDKVLPVEEVIRQNAKERREKLLRIGLAYDLAHSKGRFVESEEEERARVAREEREKRRDRKEAKEEIMKRKTYARYLNMRREITHQKDHRRAQRVQDHFNPRRPMRRDRGHGSPVRRRDRSPPGRHHRGSPPRRERPSRQKDTDNQKAADQRDQPTSPPSQSAPQTDTPDSSKPDAERKDSPAPAKTEKPNEKETPDAGAEEKGERSQERKPSGGEQTQRDLAETETESFKTARADSLPIVFEEPRHYCESESDAESVASDLTLSTVSEPAEREIDYRLEDQGLGPPPGPSPEPPLPPMGPPPGPPGGPDPEANPWNAVVVAGLRIYHKIPEENSDEEVVKVRVVRPIPFSDDESEVEEKDEKKKEGKADRKLVSEASKGLDVDDSAKDATLEGTENERKLSIDPKQARKDNRGRRRSKLVCGTGRPE